MVQSNSTPPVQMTVSVSGRMISGGSGGGIFGSRGLYSSGSLQEIPVIVIDNDRAMRNKQNVRLFIIDEYNIKLPFGNRKHQSYRTFHELSVFRKSSWIRS